ncbi:MAG: ferrochelatase [Myxococcota bacterium]
MAEFDALLFVSFGGPEKPDDVMPFLRRVVAGRNVPDERLQVVAEHYHHFGGKSPINDQNRALIAAIEQDFAAHDVKLPVYFGNRNWHPLLPDTLREMKAAGVRRALAFFTSAYSSYSGCRQYRENIAAAQAEVEGAPEIVFLRRFFNHPGFVEANVERAKEALGSLTDLQRAGVRLVFTAHSVPMSMARTSRYEEQLREMARLVAEAVGVTEWDLVWQSRSGPPQIPWLEPDILDHLKASTDREDRPSAVVISPIGFVSDHMEVVYDLDHEAKELAEELGLPMVRAKTAGTHPAFVQMVRHLVEEYTQEKQPLAVGNLAPKPMPCGEDCCPRPARPGRPKPSA